MRRTAHRLAAVTATLVAAAALPIVATTPAQATTKQCKTFLAEAGYKVGPKVHAACSVGSGIVQNYAACLAGLMSLNVRTHVAEVACERAGYFK